MSKERDLEQKDVFISRCGCGAAMLACPGCHAKSYCPACDVCTNCKHKNED